MRRQAYDVMNLKALRCFYVMAQRESVTQASIRLGISEAAVSQRIKALERYLRIKLYQSRGGHVRLTQAGERAFSLAASVFDVIDDFEHSLEQGEEAAEITLSASDSILSYLLPAKTVVFLRSHPRTRLRLLSRPVEETLRLVRTNEFDLGVIAERRLPKELLFQPMVTLPACLILSKGHPLAGQARCDFQSVMNRHALARYPLILPDMQQEGLRLSEALAQLDIPLTTSLEVGTADTLKLYVARGLGIAVITALSITPEDKERLEVVTLPSELEGGTTYGIVTRRDKRRSLLLARFVKLLLNESPSTSFEQS